MKSFLAFPVICLSLVTLCGATTSVDLISLSVQIHQATTRNALGQDVTLNITSTENVNSINGELGIADENVPFTHQSSFVMWDPTTLESFIFPFALDVPDPGDANGNGLSDFFDEAMAVEGVRTQGRHPTDTGGGTDFTATWNRAAGQPAGTVILDLPYFGLRFTHPFSLMNYRGTFTYTNNNQKLEGSIAITNILSADDPMSGPLTLTVTNNDTLGYVAGSWHGLIEGILYNYSPIDALDRIGTNYVSLIGFEDGFSPTGEADYLFWFFVIHSSDANNNSVLDLVEKTTETPAPKLAIAKAAEGIQITVQGSAGVSYALEGSEAVSGAPWNSIQTLTLSAGTQTILVPSNAAKAFYRLRQM